MAGLGFHIPYVQRDIHYVQVDIHYVQMDIDYVQLAPATPLSTCPMNYRFSTVLSTVPFARTGPCNATFYLTHELQHKLAPKKASDFPPPQKVNLSHELPRELAPTQPPPVGTAPSKPGDAHVASFPSVFFKKKYVYIFFWAGTTPSKPGDGHAASSQLLFFSTMHTVQGGWVHGL